jgi:hypothetical protein
MPQNAAGQKLRLLIEAAFRQVVIQLRMRCRGDAPGLSLQHASHAGNVALGDELPDDRREELRVVILESLLGRTRIQVIMRDRRLVFNLGRLRLLSGSY